MSQVPKKLPVRKSNFDLDPPTRVTSTQGPGADGGRAELPTHVTVLRVRSGLEAGKLIVLSPGEWVAGRSNNCHIILRDADCSRQHAKVIVSGQGRCFVSDLKSTNGIYCNSQKIVGTQELKAGDELRFSDRYVFQIERLDIQDARKHEALYIQATQDSLTGAYNRKFFEGCFKSALANPHEHSHLGLIIFDADHFKKVNDTFGHVAGDAVLRAIADRTRQSIRAEDIFARIGGEEFLILAYINNENTLQMLAERLRVSMSSQAVVFQDKVIPFTISIGTVFFSTTKAKDFESVYKIVDAALYHSKESGRNRATHKVL